MIRKSSPAGFTLLSLVCSTGPLVAQETNAPTQLPDVVVTGTQAAGGLMEEQPVGAYNQPEWTTARRFPSTRIYLQQIPWGTGFEQWVRFQHFHGGTDVTRMQEEFEVGLPHRFQVDLYETWSIDQDRRAAQDEYSGEIRYALADWGKIPLNPTLYLEYAEHNHAPNTLEGKLLFGTDISPRWHWGLNVADEQELSGTQNTELAASQGISYTLLDDKLGVGVEMEYYNERTKGTPTLNEFLLGPSAQWRITSRWHLDLVPLFGCTYDSPTVEAYLVLGFDFGTGKKERYTPVNLRNNH